MTTPGGKLDFDAIARAALGQAESLLRRWLPAGKKIANEYEVGSLAGEAGSSLKVNLKTGAWCDFANPEIKGGDLIALYAAIKGTTQADAARELSWRFGLGDDPGKPLFKPRPAAPRPAPAPIGAEGKRDADDPTPETWEPAVVPDDKALPNPPLHPKWKAPDAVWSYRTADRRVAFIVCRWEKGPRGRKLIMPLSWGKQDGIDGFWWKHWRGGRPIYRLVELQATPVDRPVLVVEGEKTADAAQRLLGDRYAVVSWSGGGNAVRLTDWSALKGRAVTVWPDRDRHVYDDKHKTKAGQEKPWAEQPGRKTAQSVGQLAAEAGAASVAIIEPPADVKDGWDLADAETEGWTGDRAAEWMRDHWSPFAGDGEGHEGGEGEDDPGEDCPFTPLGHRAGEYFILSPAGEVRSIAAARMNAAGLESLLDGATGWYWDHFGSLENRINAGKARRWVMRACLAEGIYDARMPHRGPGVWRDEADAGGGLLVHAGDGLLIGGAWQRPGMKRAGALYVAGARVVRPAAEPATAEEAAGIERDLRRWNWAESWGPLLATGFIAQGFLGAAPPWRAHCYVLAPHGSGKTALCVFVQACLGGAAHAGANNYTEAGLRQALTGEARVMVLDEAERSDANGYRIQAVIEMIRHMSGAEGATFLRGTSGGHAMGFHLAGAAWLSSIGQGRLKPQDRSRITTLRLAPLPKGGDAATAQAAVRAATERMREASPRLWRRMIDGWDRFRANLEAYRSAMIGAGCDPREADQIATLFAARETLIADTVIDPAAAGDMVAGYASDGLLGTIDDAGEESEGNECLVHLFTSVVDKVIRGDRRTVAQLVSDALEQTGVADRQAVQAIGLKVLPQQNGNEAELWVANLGDGIERVFAGTRWADGGWIEALRSLPGCHACPKPRYIGGVKRRFTVIPAHWLPYGEREPVPDGTADRSVPVGVP